MKEILAWGDISKELERLNISPKKAWSNRDISVYQLTEEELKTMSDDENWSDNFLAWRYSEGSNLPAPNYPIIINGYEITAWPSDCGCNLCADCEEWEGCFPDGEAYRRYCSNETPPDYNNLIAYINEAKDYYALSSITHLSVDLAHYNDMTLVQLFEKYQGEEGDCL